MYLHEKEYLADWLRGVYKSYKPLESSLANGKSNCDYLHKVAAKPVTPVLACASIKVYTKF